MINLKLLGETIGENLYDLRSGNESLGKMPKA